MDKQVYVLTKLPKIDENIARSLIKLGVSDIRAVRTASDDLLKKAGLTDSNIAEIRDLLLRWGG